MEFSDIIESGERGFLDGHFLLAMPGMRDERFEKSVVLIAAHSDRGALGFIVNHSADVELDDMYGRVGVSPNAHAMATAGIEPPREIDIIRGGPVESTRGFVLHSPDYGSSSTLRLNETLSITSTIDILKALGRGAGPKRAMLALGYAAWSGDQLESELCDNAWLTTDADTDLMFDVPADERYTAAFAGMGIALEALSGVAGNA